MTTQSPLADIAGGDYILPRISPDGRAVAFAALVRTDSSLTSQILIYRIGDQRLDTLLTADAARKYATYSAYPVSLNWLSASRLTVGVSDGDVDVTRLEFDLESGLMSESRGESADAGDILPPHLQALADSLGALYAEVSLDSSVEPSQVFASGLVWPHVRGTRSVILQKRYARVDDDIWLFDLSVPSATRLLTTPQGPRASMSGGAFLGSDAVFGVGADTVTIFRMRNGAVDSLTARVAKRQNHSLQARTRLQECVWLLFDSGTQDTFSRGEILVFDGDSLAPMLADVNTYDFDVSADGSFIAVSHWLGDTRQIRLRPLAGRCVA